MALIIGGEECWTTQQAATAMGVSPTAIRTWRKRGYLQPHPRSPQGHPIYRRLDVCAAEKMAYDAAMRTSGSKKRTSRAA